MKSPWIAALRSMALAGPDLSVAETFDTEVWQRVIAARGDGVICLHGSGSGSGSDHHLLGWSTASRSRPS